MVSKEQLGRLVETLKRLTGLTQEEISERAGYKPKTLSQIISSGGNPKSAYSRLLLVFKDELKDSTYIPQQVMKPKDPIGMVLENQIELMASSRVILGILAESEAARKGSPAKQFENIFRQMVKDEAEQVRGELRQRG